MRGRPKWAQSRRRTRIYRSSAPGPEADDRVTSASCHFLTWADAAAYAKEGSLPQTWRGRSDHCRRRAEGNDGSEMRDNAAEHETMPDRIGPSADVAGVDDGTHCIEPATQAEEHERDGGYAANDIVADSDSQPADREIEADAGTVERPRQDQLDNDAG